MTYDFVNSWLDYTLKNDCNAFTVFQDSVATSSRITYDQACNTVLPTIDITVAQTANQLSSNQNGATAYRWLNCTNNYAPIPNETNQTYSPTSNGNYAVEITVNGCKDTSNCISYTGSLGIGLQNLSTINFYPNPAKDILSISTTENIDFTLIITDLNGKTVLTQNNVTNESTISLSTIEAGSYFMTFSSENQKVIQRFIKQ